MPKHRLSRKLNPITCGCGCLTFLILIILIIHIAGEISVRIAERNIFLIMDNITLLETCDLIPFHNDQKTAVFHDGLRYNNIHNGIILKESDDYLVLVETTHIRGFGIISIDPKKAFQRKSHFFFYRILKEMAKDETYEVKTEFLGSIETNLYGEWNQKHNSISISPDGKTITMSAHGVNSRSLGKYRNKALLLTWEIGDNVVEKDVIVRHYKKTIPLIIKTEEELESE